MPPEGKRFDFYVYRADTGTFISPWTHRGWAFVDQHFPTEKAIWGKRLLVPQELVHGMLAAISAMKMKYKRV